MIGRNIRRFRREFGLTQAHLARQAGLSQQYLSLVERGLSPSSAEHISCLARALGIAEHVLTARSITISTSDEHGIEVRSHV